MQVLIQATVVGASRRKIPAKDGRPESTYAQVFIGTDLEPNADSVGQTVDALRLGDAALVDVFRHAKLPAAFLLVCDQQTYGDVTRTTVTAVRDPIAVVKPAAAAR